MTDLFHRFARSAARMAGTPWAFIGAIAFIVVWGLTGPFFGYSNTWQLIVNTSTTIVTFLMVFLLQNSQNRDSEALQLKLDEVIRAMRGARNEIIAVENLTDEELEKLQERYEKLREKQAVNRSTTEAGKGTRGGRTQGMRAKDGSSEDSSSNGAGKK